MAKSSPETRQELGHAVKNQGKFVERAVDILMRLRGVSSGLESEMGVERVGRGCLAEAAVCLCYDDVADIGHTSSLLTITTINGLAV